MSKANGDSLHLTGIGAAYIRVSTDQQDTERQFASIRAFEKRHAVSIAKQHWFKDEGWTRDEADERPDFQRMIKEAKAGRVQWIVVDALDRFGTKNAKKLIVYLDRLEEAGCKLYDAAGKEWTGQDIGTTITAVVEGEKSKGEQISKSHRVLGGKIAKARAGEWQGGPVRLGFEVVCFHRETGKELWRVVFEDRHQRLKVYPDGRTERFDGKANFPKFQPTTEVLRVAPSNDKAKIDAAISVFKRYATEAISFTALAHYLDKLGFRNSCGGPFRPHRIEAMLEDPIFLGFYTWNKTHFGKFHRYHEGQLVLELNYDEKFSKNDKADWVQSRRLFEPMVDRSTWDAVQRKLEQRSKRTNAPRSVGLYLSGLVVCGNCGGRMVAGRPISKPKARPRRDGFTGERREYICGTYFAAVKVGKRTECRCLRNGVFQDTLEMYVGRYLDETSQRLALLTQEPGGGNLTGRLEGQETEAWQAFRDGIARLTSYLAHHHPEQYAKIVEDSNIPQEIGGPSPDDFVEACVEAYRNNFDPARLTAEVEKLEAEHTAMMHRYADLPTPRAKDKAKAELAALEERIAELEQQKQDMGEVVATAHREMHDLQLAIAAAKIAMRSETGERAMRQRTETLRGVIQRIECKFVATGKTGSGPGKRNARLVEVVIEPVSGDSVRFAVPDNVLRLPREVTLGSSNTFFRLLLRIVFIVP